MGDYGHWIRQAESCRRTAETAPSETLRRRFLDFAAQYDALAAAEVPNVVILRKGCPTRPLMLARKVSDPGSENLIRPHPARGAASY